MKAVERGISSLDSSSLSSLPLSLPSPLPLSYSISLPPPALPPPRPCVTIDTNSNRLFSASGDQFTPTNACTNPHGYHMFTNHTHTDTNYLNESVPAVSLATPPPVLNAIKSNSSTPCNINDNNNNIHSFANTNCEYVPFTQNNSVDSTPMDVSSNSWLSPDARSYSDESANRSGCPTPTSDLPEWARHAVWSVEDESTPRIPRSVYEHTLCEQMDETTALAMYTSLIENFPRNQISRHSPLPSPQTSMPRVSSDERNISPSLRHPNEANASGCRSRRDREWEALFASPLNEMPIQDQLSSLLQQQQLQHIHQQQQQQQQQQTLKCQPELSLQSSHQIAELPFPRLNLPPSRPLSQQPYDTLLPQHRASRRPKSQTPSSFNC